MPDAAGRTGSVRSEGGGTCPFPGTIGEGGRGAAFIAGTVPIVTWPSRARCTARVVCEEPDSQRGSRWTSARTIRPTSGRPRLSRRLHAPTVACAHHARVGLRLQVSDTEVPAARIIADHRVRSCGSTVGCWRQLADPRICRRTSPRAPTTSWPQRADSPVAAGAAEP